MTSNNIDGKNIIPNSASFLKSSPSLKGVMTSQIPPQVSPPGNHYLDTRHFTIEAGPRRDWLHQVRLWLGNEEADRLLKCHADEWWDTYYCLRCGRKVYRPVGKCSSSYCPVCEGKYSGRKGAQSFRRLKPWGSRWGLFFDDKEEDELKWAKEHTDFADGWLPVKRDPPPRKLLKTPRNKPCSCGSGRKAKYCCFPQLTEERERELERRRRKLGVWPCFEFTTPEEYREEIEGRNIDETHRNFNRLFKVVRISLEEVYGLMVGGLMTVHSWGSREPWTFKPHISVIIAGWGYKDGKFIRLRTVLRKWELKRLRRIYKKNLEKEFGWKVNGEVDVYYLRRHNEKQLLHRVRYMLRPPVGSYEELQEIPEGELFKVLKHFHLRRKWRFYRWFGFLSHNVYKRYCEVRGIEPEPWDDKLPWNECPYCGGELFLVERVRGEDHKIVNQELFERIEARSPP